MCIDMKEGESVIAYADGGFFNLKLTIEKKNGRGVRVVVTAPKSITIIPPNMQEKITPR